MSEMFNSTSLLHFHWVCDLIDYLDSMKRVPEDLPLVWTLHDMGAFTGGCSYSLGCERFEESCGECPQLSAASARHETFLSHGRKAQAVHGIKEQLTLVCPSEWMAKMASRSSIFEGVRCEVIRNGFDLETFSPNKRDQGRQMIACDPNEIVILFVAASFENPLKGMKTLIESLRHIDNPSIRICYLGDKGEGQFPEEWQWLGKIHDEEKLANLYAGSDFLIVPSEADNYPNVICEALACGVPVIASEIGGIPELVVEAKTGYLFEKGNSSALLDRITRMAEGLPREREKWSLSCRSFAEETFEIEKITQRHIDLYNELGWYSPDA
ncbi:glycosyltransferase [Oceanipulchritudo coccoides]